MENDEPSISKTRWPNQSPATSVAGTRILTTARRTVWKTANGSRARAWQKALAVKARPASKETWVEAVLPWRTWMRNQWIMAAGVKRQRSHHEWPAWRQAWWMKSQPSLAARSCLRVLRVVEIRRCIAGPPVPWWVRKMLLCTGVPLFSRDEDAWGYRCLNDIRNDLNCCGKMPSLRRAGLPGSFNLPKQLRMSPFVYQSERQSQAPSKSGTPIAPAAVLGLPSRAASGRPSRIASSR